MKTRIIYTKIWNDPWFIELPYYARYFFIYLLTSGSVNLPGIYELSEKQIFIQTGLTKDLVKRAKTVLAEKILFTGNWVIIKNIERYDTFSGNNLFKAKESQLEEVPITIREKAREFRDTPSEGYPYPLDTSDSNSNSNSNKEGGFRGKQLLDDQAFIKELKEKFPEHDVDYQLDSMKDWLASSGRRYQDYAAFARNWMRRATPREKAEMVVIR